MSDEKFKNKYRIPSARAQWWDYGNNAAYFITICSVHREHFFGKISNGKMQLSTIGIITDVFWYEILKHSEYIKLGEFVVMPNHVHGILIIDKPSDIPVVPVIPIVPVVPVVETRHALSLPQKYQMSHQIFHQTPISQSPGEKRFQNQGKNTLSSIIGGFKSVVTKHSHRLGYDFKWQARFHDHIIRDAEEYQRIANYIANNQRNWKDDRFYSE